MRTKHALCFNLFCLLLGCVDRTLCPNPAAPKAAAATTASPLYVGAGDPYAPGSLPVRKTQVQPCETGAPVELSVYSPEPPGRYPVVLFEHGFTMSKDYYTELLTHLASHGFVVIAPQTYAPANPFGAPPTSVEADRVAAVLDWADGNLSEVAGVTADCALLGLAGHSRGPKVTCILAERGSRPVGAIAHIDPVDSAEGGRVTAGPATYIIPTLVVGTGLGDVPAGIFSTACAPPGDNHVQFYAAAQSPAWHVVATDAGHMDILDSRTLGTCGIVCQVCTYGPNPDATRRLVGGLMVALFRGTLQGDAAALAYLADGSAAPDPIQVELK